MAIDQDFWEDLIDKIDEGKVIPVVGQAAVTYGPDDHPFYPRLARRMAEKLEVQVLPLPAELKLHEVVGDYLAAGGERNKLYTRIARVIRTEAPAPGATLLALARIAHFKLFLTTAIDPLLETAMNTVRYGGVSRAETLSFFPGSPADLPHTLSELSRATVYHLLGRASTTPGEYVAWEEDLLDFICELQRHIGSDPMRRLSVELKSHCLLVLGVNFADWPVRLLLRVASQDSLSRVKQFSLLAEGPPGPDTKKMVLFFGGVTKNINVVECNPQAFASELAARWLERTRLSVAARKPAQSRCRRKPKCHPARSSSVMHGRMKWRCNALRPGLRPAGAMSGTTGNASGREPISISS